MPTRVKMLRNPSRQLSQELGLAGLREGETADVDDAVAETLITRNPPLAETVAAKKAARAEAGEAAPRPRQSFQRVEPEAQAAPKPEPAKEPAKK